MYALEGLGNLGARHPKPKIIDTQKIQQKITIAQQKISKLQTQLQATTNVKQKHKIEADIIEWQKRLSDYQLQLTTPPPPTPTTPTIPTPLDIALPYTGQQPSTTWMTSTNGTGTVQVSPPPAPAVSVPVSDWFSNPWLLGGAAIVVFLILRR